MTEQLMKPQSTNATLVIQGVRAQCLMNQTMARAKIDAWILFVEQVGCDKW